MKIYLARNNVQAGPYSLDELNTMLSSGEVQLGDLMWHTGMSQWQTVGHMTNNHLFYQPHGASPKPPSTPPFIPKPTTPQRGFGDNVDFHKEAESRRVSVDELYGRPVRHDATPQTIPLSKAPSDIHTSIEYASISSRFGAFAINVGLYLLALLPLIIALMGVADMNEIAKHAQDYAQMQAYSETLAKQIPNTTIATSNIMLFALIGIQLLLIIMRGQSFGKMVMGIRVLDEKTHRLPKLGTLLFIRTCLVVMAYVIGATMMSGLPALVMLTCNYLVAKKSPTSQGWHDRVSKTIVVKAQPIQLDKNKSHS